MLVLTVPVQFHIGKRFHKAAYKALSHKSATMDVLISLGTNIAFVFSCISLLYTMITFGKHVQENKKKPIVFFETCVTLITFISFGRWLENKAKGKLIYIYFNFLWL